MFASDASVANVDVIRFGGWTAVVASDARVRPMRRNRTRPMQVGALGLLSGWPSDARIYCVMRDVSVRSDAEARGL